MEKNFQIPWHRYGIHGIQGDKFPNSKFQGDTILIYGSLPDAFSVSRFMLGCVMFRLTQPTLLSCSFSQKTFVNIYTVPGIRRIRRNSSNSSMLFHSSTQPTMLRYFNHPYFNIPTMMFYIIFQPFYIFHLFLFLY